MSIVRGNTKILDVKRGSTQIKKICRGSVVIWECGESESGESESGKLFSAKWSGTSNGGMTYKSDEILLGGSCTIEKFGFYNKLLRNDINGKEEGRFVAKGWNGEKWVVLVNYVTNNQTEWDINVVITSRNTSVNVSKIMYEFYIVDDITRKYNGTMEMWVSSIYHK